MIIEFIVAAAIVTLACRIIYKSVQKKASGQCDCGSCSVKCPKYLK